MKIPSHILRRLDEATRKSFRTFDIEDVSGDLEFTPMTGIAGVRLEYDPNRRRGGNPAEHEEVEQRGGDGGIREPRRPAQRPKRNVGV